MKLADIKIFIFFQNGCEYVAVYTPDYHDKSLPEYDVSLMGPGEEINELKFKISKAGKWENILPETKVQPVNILKIANFLESEKARQ